jgi:hypothetical protein
VSEKINVPEYISKVSIKDYFPKKSTKEYAIDKHIQNLKKHDAAILLVKKAKFLVNDVSNQMCECKIMFDKDLAGYENAKKSLSNNGLNACEFLLSQLCYVSKKSAQSENEIIFEPKDNFELLDIQDVSSGKVTAIFLALILSLMAGVLMVFMAIKQLNINYDLSIIPMGELINPVLNWHASFFGMDDKPLIGAMMIAVVMLFIAWFSYTRYIEWKEKKNLAMAKEQLRIAEYYCDDKLSCQDQMKRVDKFINKAIDILKLYQIVLGEQEEKLRKILHEERSNISTSDFYSKSLRVMQNTQELINYIKDFMAVPMSEEGKLSAKSGLFLLRAQNRIEKVINRRQKIDLD